MGRFKITNITPAYEPKIQTEPAWQLNKELAAVCDKTHDTSHKIYIRPKALTRIFTHIGWGTKTKNNIVEQGGILLGHTFIDPKTKVQYAVVEDAIAGKTARGTSAYLEMGHEVWKQMIDEVDELLDEEDETQIIGWFHTHPNNLSVFMSATDMGTQRRFFSEKWQYAIVMNPHKQIWKAFYGNDAVPCAGFVVQS